MSGARRSLLTITVMMATLMQVLDTTIANVALPHMQAALGASQDTIAWVLTSYIVTAAIATPVTGWLEARFGRRKLFAVAIAGFTLSSALCGVSVSLGMMVLSRALQGMFGAFISPLSQAVMLDSYPPEKRAEAMMIWGMGVMIGPIMGPVLGGWLTDSFDWRWVFFINVPFGIVCVAGLWLLMDEQGLPKRRFDMTGFLLLAVALACFQIMLDRGTQQDWFDSVEIIAEAGIAAAAFWMFLVHSATARHPLIPPGVLRDRNFVIANVYLFLVMGTSMAGSALLAPMIQNLLGYDTMQAGIAMAPRGLGMMVAMLAGGRLSGKVDSRVLIMTGLGLVALSLHMQSRFNLDIGWHELFWSGLVQGFGMGLVVLPLNLLAFATLSPALRTDGTSFYSLSRNVGGSIGISVASAMLAHNTQVSHSDLTVHLTDQTLPFLNPSMVQGMAPSGMLGALADAEVNRQALMIAYLDDFYLMMWATMVAIPLLIFMRGAGKAGSEDTPMVME